MVQRRRYILNAYVTHSLLFSKMLICIPVYISLVPLPVHEKGHIMQLKSIVFNIKIGKCINDKLCI